MFDVNVNGLIESTDWLSFLSHATQSISIPLANCRIEFGRRKIEEKWRRSSYLPTTSDE